MIAAVSGDPTVTEALQQWQGRSQLPTELGHADLRTFGRDLRQRSVFSARMTNAEAVAELQEVVGDILAGKINLAEGRFRMLKKLKSLGYDPKVGFPQDMADVPPAEVDSLQDLTSKRRLDLMLETNVRMARGYGQKLGGMRAAALIEFPAWELVRRFTRTIERGTPQSHTEGWQRRWQEAGTAVDWRGAAQGRMVALKTSPIWAALGDGEGGFTDTLDNDFPPFAFNSGMGWRAVPKQEAAALGLAPSTASAPAAEKPSFAMAENATTRALARLPENLRAAVLQRVRGVAA